MQLHYTLTLEDYLEAQRAHSLPEPMEEPGSGARAAVFWGVVIVVFVGMLVVLAKMDRKLQAEAQRKGLERPWLVVSAVATMVPMGVAAAGFLVVFRRSLRPADRWQMRYLFFVMCLVTTANSVMMTWIQEPEPPKPPRQMGLAEALLMPVAPWLVLLVVLWMVLLAFMRRTVRRTWDAQQHLHRPERVTVLEHGLLMEQDRMRSEYRWDAFLKYRESEGLFLLYIGDAAYLMVAKRGFADGPQVDAFRGMIHWHISGARGAGQGAVAAPPPLPGGGA